jgi:hypothetical protein
MSRPLQWTAYSVIVAAHLYALIVYGAIYWIDQRDYVSLATSIGSSELMNEYYESIGTWVFSHLGVGTPLVWLAFQPLPTAWQWPALALFQHSLAAAVLIFAYDTLVRLWPSPLHLFFILALLVLPAYEAFHNALLTESCTSSLVLLGFSCCLRIALDKPKSARYIVLALTSLALVTQFRSYWGAILALMTFCALGASRRVWSGWTIALILVSLCAAGAFPVYRYLQIGSFFLPSGGINFLVSGSQVNPRPSGQVLAAFEGVELPESLPASKLIRDGITMEDAINIANYWRDEGLSNEAIVGRAGDLGKVLRNDGALVQFNRTLYGLTSIGMLMPYLAINPAQEVLRGWSASNFFAFVRDYYRWQTGAEEADYHREFVSFFAKEPSSSAFPFADSSNASMRSVFEPYLTSSPLILRDPLKLGRVFPDVWAVTALVLSVLLARRSPIVPVLLLCAVLPAFGVAYMFPLGNPRYAIPLIPLYFATSAIAASCLLPRWLGKLELKSDCGSKFNP